MRNAASALPEESALKTRIISGAVLAVILVAVLFFGGLPLLIALLFCSLVGMYEVDRALGAVTEEKKMTPVAAAGLISAVLLYVVLFFKGDAWYGEIGALAVVLIMGTYVVAFSVTDSSQTVASVFSFFYVAYILGFIYLLRAGENGLIHVIPVFLSSWIADTCAYFTCMKFGKHKMTPVLSPKKTLEGAAGGILGAAAAGLLFAFFADRGHLWQYPLICAAASVISIFGDLAASAIKRDREIKDYGKLIPGHGGIMDRFDSVIFTAPVIYFLTKLLMASGV